MSDNDAAWAIVYDYRLTKEIDVAALTVLIYDWLDSLNDESRYIWREQWKFSKILFFLARYPAIINQVIILFYSLLFGSSGLTCGALLTTSSVLTVMMYIICETILLLRTSALHRSDRKFFWSLSVVFCLSAIGAMVAIIIWNSSLHWFPPPTPNLPGCILKGPFTTVLVTYGIIAFWEITIFILAARKGYKQHRSSRLPLYMVLWYDGFQYYVYALVGSLIEVFVLVALPVNMVGIGSTCARTIHAICACRILLHARAHAESNCNNDHIDNRRSQSLSPFTTANRRELEVPLEYLQSTPEMDSQPDRIFELTGIRTASS